MTVSAPGEWIHIAGDAWELHETGVQYTLHKKSEQWVARSFLLNHEGDATKDAEESALTIEGAKEIVDRWESQSQL